MKNKLADIQVLRFTAAFLVVISHTMKELNGGLYQVDNFFSITLVGQFGVDLFFVISGFIMMYVSRNYFHGIRTSIDFFIKRICRIVPLYWLFTFFTVVITLFIPEFKNNNFFDFNYLFSSLLFIPFERGDGNVTPVLGLGWTLNYEMFFYIIFAVVLFFKSKYRALLFSLILILFVISGFIYDFGNIIIDYLSNSIILEFLFGYWLAKVFIAEYRLSYLKSTFLVLAGFICIYLSTFLDVVPSELEMRGVYWGIPAALIFAGVMLCDGGFFRFLPGKVHKALTRLGDGSFSLYLGHMFVIRAVSLVLPLFVGGVFYELAYFVIVIIISFILSDYMYRYFEVPSNKLALKLLRR